MPKGCAYIASTESTECPEPRNQGGTIDHPIREIWGMIGMNSFTYVQQVLYPFEMNNLKDPISTQFMHRNLYEILPS